MAPVPTPDANLSNLAEEEHDNIKNHVSLPNNNSDFNHNMEADEDALGKEAFATLTKVPSDDITVITGSPENNNKLSTTITTRKTPSPRFVALVVAIAMLGAIATGIYFFVNNNRIVVLNASDAAAKERNDNFQDTPISLAELATHNMPNEDCWLLIGNHVYDLTIFATRHPGGAAIITDLCGSNGTQEYLLTHSFSLLKTIPEALIGSVEDGFTSTGTTGVPAPAPSPTIRAPVGFPGGTMGGASQPVENTPTVFISEIHYDNAKLDIDQMIEVAFSNTLDVSGYTIDFIRGKTQLIYGQASLQAFILGDTVNGLTFASIIVPSLQNGPDGLALIDGDGNVVEFISYNGTITSKDGATAGMNSTDIGVTESGFDPVGYSLQKTGAGCSGSDFTWYPTVAESTAGTINVGMTVTCYNSGSAPIPAPTPWAETYAPTVSCYGEHYDYSTIASHASTSDCWEAINDVVYDFTIFATLHGGGPEQIWPHCGTDATVPFTNRHAQSFLRMITDYIIGYVAVDGLTGQQPVPCMTRRLLDEHHAENSEEWEYEELE